MPCLHLLCVRQFHSDRNLFWLSKGSERDLDISPLCEFMSWFHQPLMSAPTMSCEALCPIGRHKDRLPSDVKISSNPWAYELHLSTLSNFYSVSEGIHDQNREFTGSWLLQSIQTKSLINPMVCLFNKTHVIGSLLMFYSVDTCCVTVSSKIEIVHPGGKLI